MKRFSLYQLLSTAFCVILVMSNVISAKMIALPFFDFTIPAGLIAYPLTFLLSDLVTEIYGPRQAKTMVYIALIMSVLSFLLIYIALRLPTENAAEQSAFEAILGLSNLRIFSSLVAYLSAQAVDIYLYSLLKRKTRWLWLRSNGSTWLSQLVDTLVIDLLFLYWGLGLALAQVLPVMVFSYFYKAIFTVACTPFFCLSVSWIRKKSFSGETHASRSSIS